MNVEDKLHLLSIVINVENQKHRTYIKLQNKSKFYRQLSQFLIFSLVAQISLTQPRNFKANFIALNHGNFEALGHGNCIAIGLSTRWLYLIVTHKIEVEVFHQLLYSSPTSSNLPQFSRVSSSIDTKIILPDSSRFFNGGKFSAFSCFVYKFQCLVLGKILG